MFRCHRTESVFERGKSRRKIESKQLHNKSVILNWVMDLFSAAKIHSDFFSSVAFNHCISHSHIWIQRFCRSPRQTSSAKRNIENDRTFADKILNSKMENGEQSADWRVLYNRALETNREESALHIREMTHCAISCDLDANQWSHRVQLHHLCDSQRREEKRKKCSSEIGSLLWCNRVFALRRREREVQH